MEKKNTEDEIDLLLLFLKSINIIRANFWLILSFFFLGIALGVVHYNVSGKVYENKMVISSGILTSSYGSILIGNLNRHRIENDIKSLATSLQISEKTAREINLIKIDNLTEATELTESERFVITVKVRDQDILPDLQRGLVHYLENNEFVKIRVDHNKKFLRQMIAKIDLEIRDMEEFKARIFKGNFFQSLNGNVMFDPTSVNSKILDLTKERIGLQNNLELANSVQIVQGFTRFENPASPRLSVSLLGGALAGLFFVTLFILLKGVRKLLRMAEKARPISL